MIVPQKLFGKISAAKYATDISGSGFIQRALAVYFKNGCWGENINALTRVYKQRLDFALKIVSQWRKLGVKTGDPGGGFGLWLTLPDGITDREIYYSCKERNVLVAPGSSFYTAPMAGFESH
jgi:DNA-binding transcriptional MocR family regulator